MPQENNQDKTSDTAHSENSFMHPLTKEPITIPRSAAWNYLAFEHHRQPPGECAYSLPQHHLRIALATYLPFERRVNDGRLHSFSVTPGSLAICPAFIQQWMRWETHAEFLLLSLPPSLLVRLAEEADIPGDSIELIAYEEELEDPLLFQIGQALQATRSEEATPFSAMYMETLANSLAAHLLKRYCRYSGRQPFALPAPEQFSSSTWQHMLEYIQTYLDQPLTLSELAAVAGMSTYHFARSFKQTIGLSPHQYILRARIELAKTLLLKGEQSMSELVTRLGFADQSHFTRSFKRFVGMTPGTFVQKYSKNLPGVRTFIQDEESHP